MIHKVLVCDDDKDIVAALAIYLEGEGYAVEKAYNGKEALEILEREPIHLVILDVMMPALDGLSATLQIRKTKNLPIILLTAKSEEIDKVLGLQVGADDYITKPFHPIELLARVKSQLRRYTVLGGIEQQPSVLRCGPIELCDDQKQVTVDGEAVSLTPLEYNLLLFLMQHPGKVFSSIELYRAIWQDAPFGGEGTVAVHIRHLREKIEIDPGAPRYLKVVWGHGYKLEGD